MSKQTPEGEVKDGITGTLDKVKAYWFKPVSNGMGKHGIPDVVACIPVKITQEMVGDTVGLFAGIEAKKLDVTEPTPRQRNQLREIAQAHGIALLINKERLERFEAGIQALCKNND